MATLGQRIKRLRESKGMSQIELGKLVNVGNTTISQWESDKRSPDISTVNKLADIFGTTSDYFLGRTDDPASTTAKGHPEIAELSLAEGLSELTPEAKKEVLDFIEYVKAKYAKKEGDDKK